MKFGHTVDGHGSFEALPSLPLINVNDGQHAAWHKDSLTLHTAHDLFA